MDEKLHEDQFVVAEITIFVTFNEQGEKQLAWSISEDLRLWEAIGMLRAVQADLEHDFYHSD